MSWLHRMRAGQAILSIVLAMAAVASLSACQTPLAAPAAAVQADDALAAAMGSAAEGLARKLSVEAQREPGLVVAVRPARMVLDGKRYLPCPTLGNDLRDVLAERLEHERQRKNLGFQVQVVDAGEEAPMEVNTEWRHDERSGADVMRGTVQAKVGERSIREPFEVPAARLTEGQKGCLMRWTLCTRPQENLWGDPVIVWEEPGVGRELRKYLHNEEMDIRGDLEPIGGRGGWWLVWVKDLQQYGFAKAKDEGACLE